MKAFNESTHGANMVANSLNKRTKEIKHLAKH